MKLADREADFRDFYFAEAGKLRRLAILMVGDADRAEDLAHDALLKAFKSWGRIRSDDPGPYVRQALVNGCRNHLRRRAVERRKASAAPVDAPDVSPSLIEALRVAAALERALAGSAGGGAASLLRGHATGRGCRDLGAARQHG